MSGDFAAAAVWGVALLVLVVIAIAVLSGDGGGRGSSGVGPAASGAIYDLLNQDKRNAIELIVEEKAAARDPEDADGNLPDLDQPTRFR
ncbi:MAG TPA: hypothetical protein VFK57_25700 [Vicinamibacterales bacterium]|nr:hypothetical protein [Vicinamibacterales bacterium]